MRDTADEKVYIQTNDGVRLSESSVSVAGSSPFVNIQMNMIRPQMKGRTADWKRKYRHASSSVRMTLRRWIVTGSFTAMLIHRPFQSTSISLRSSDRIYRLISMLMVDIWKVPV